VTSVIRIVASFFDIIIVKRWNVAWHIPDKARLPTSAPGLGSPLTTHGSWRPWCAQCLALPQRRPTHTHTDTHAHTRTHTRTLHRLWCVWSHR
jgi:hypothetical protein